MDFLLPYLRSPASRSVWKTFAHLRRLQGSIPASTRQCSSQSLSRCINNWIYLTTPRYNGSRVRARARPQLPKLGVPLLRFASTVTDPTSTDSIPQSSIPGTDQSDGFFPHYTDKAVGYWLLASAASVFGIVVFGGLTRLTESG